MPERDYSHRDVVDKLGVKAGLLIAFGEGAAAIDPDLRARVLERSGRPAAQSGERADVVLLAADDRTEVAAVLRHWRSRIEQDGGIWLLTPKRGQPGYVDQRELIAAGPEGGVVDNKTCSVSDMTSAIRFVIRKSDRVYS